MASHRAFVSSAGLRRDGRRPREVRRLKYQFGVYGDCDGSVYLEHGCNKVLVSVRGPRACEKRSAAQFDRATVTCTYQLLSFARTEHRKAHLRDRRSEQVAMSFVAPLRASFRHTCAPLRDCYFSASAASGWWRGVGCHQCHDVGTARGRDSVYRFRRELHGGSS